jgi:hypothetical protein
VRVGDLGGYVIEGALVSIVGLPNGFLRTPAATTTGVDGSTTQTLQPTVLATAARGFTPSLSIRVAAPGDSTGGLATNGVFAVPLGQSGSAAANEVNVYASGTHGYDLSFPNCARPRPRQADFAIVGVNGGRPFTFNRCLAAEYQWAATRGPVAVYLNTGYTRRLRQLISPACALAGGGPSRAAEAFAVGCSEAASSFERMTLLGLAAPAVWWLDVETSNAWSANRRLNTQVLAGMIAFLQRLTPTPVVGVYSNQSWWRKIMGGWALAAPEWIPQAPSGVCPAPFSSGSVWLSQGGSSTLDQDNSC